jgi:hypothetical protein
MRAWEAAGHGWMRSRADPNHSDETRFEAPTEEPGTPPALERGAASLAGQDLRRPSPLARTLASLDRLRTDRGGVPGPNARPEELAGPSSCSDTRLLRLRAGGPRSLGPLSPSLEDSRRRVRKDAPRPLSAPQGRRHLRHRSHQPGGRRASGRVIRAAHSRESLCGCRGGPQCSTPRRPPLSRFGRTTPTTGRLGGLQERRTSVVLRRTGSARFVTHYHQYLWVDSFVAEDGRCAGGSGDSFRSRSSSRSSSAWRRSSLPHSASDSSSTP